MRLSERIDLLEELKQWIQQENNLVLDAGVQQAYIQNPWFTPENIRKSLFAICTEYLSADKLSEWLQHYDIKENVVPKKVGLIMAGNIPLVGWHDLLCTFLAGHKSLIKSSSKDEVLVKVMLDQMVRLNKESEAYFEVVDQLTGFDAVIATGGDTAATHFEYYFSRYPHIIRKNRNSVAILDGQETEAELSALASDIFDYFGLGCRSVSKLYLPVDFDTDRLFTSFYPFRDVIHHNKYKNNFDYNHAIYVLTQQPFLTNDFIILKEDSNVASRIACLHYERYESIAEVISHLLASKDMLQCVSSRTPLEGWPYIPLGQCQKPGLMDYADHVDTMDFLLKL